MKCLNCFRNTAEKDPGYHKDEDKYGIQYYCPRCGYHFKKRKGDE